MLKFDRTMSEVTGQWLRAVRDPRFRPAEDIVAAVAGDSSGPVRDIPKIATALAEAGGSAPRTALVKPVGNYLGCEWGLAPAVAEATATKLLVFWDEAGIFVASGPGRTVSPRLQLFLEVGVALDAVSKCPEEAASWVEDTVAGDNRGAEPGAGGGTVSDNCRRIDCLRVSWFRAAGGFAGAGGSSEPGGRR